MQCTITGIIVCNKTCFVALLIRLILRGKTCTSTEYSFPAQIERINRTRHVFALITHLCSIRNTTSWKMLTNNKLKAQTLTGIHTGNLRCHVLTSRALYMSCSFGQSACSRESRVVVNPSCVECKWRRGGYLCSTQRDPCIKTLTIPSHIATPRVIILIYYFVYRIRGIFFSYCVGVTYWYMERSVT